jgi:hypothetical protein
VIDGPRYAPAMITALLRLYKFRFASEAELQRGIAEILDRHGIAYSREHVLTERDRIDFLLAGGVGIEVKVAGGVNDLLRQLARYAELPAITGLVVVASGHRLASAVPMGLRGKEMAAVNVRAGVL